MEVAMENWRSIKGYEGLYEVSDLGRVRSLDRSIPAVCHGRQSTRKKKGKVLALATASNGYKQICLSKDGSHIIYRVHRLVAEAFLDNPDGLPEVNHKDEDKTNNCFWNLEWCTHSYNSSYGSKPLCGSRNPMSKLTDEQVAEIRERRASGEMLKSIAADYGISINHVCNLAQGKRRTDETFHN